MPAAHPNFDPNFDPTRTMAIVINSTRVTKYRDNWIKAALMLNENGYDYHPEYLQNEPIMLPLFNTCVVTKEGIQITPDKMEMEPVSEMTPYTYAEGYKRFETILKSDKAPMCFDELEFAVRDDMRDLWPGDYTCIQHARIVYDMLWQFDQEGRLKREMRVQDHRHGPRHCWYFCLEN